MIKVKKTGRLLRYDYEEIEPVRAVMGKGVGEVTLIGVQIALNPYYLARVRGGYAGIVFFWGPCGRGFEGTLDESYLYRYVDKHDLEFVGHRCPMESVT
jgi:hypothetical protein